VELLLAMGLIAAAVPGETETHMAKPKDMQLAALCSFQRERADEGNELWKHCIYICSGEEHTITIPVNDQCSFFFFTN
jgi:hypothetical protein